MEKILEILDTKGKMKTKEIYSLLKTNSQKINSEISKRIKSFNEIDDFFKHYSNQSNLFDLLNKVELYSSKNYDEMNPSLDSNIEQYISCFTQIIISIRLILKTKEILSKIFLSSKQHLSKLKFKEQVENISQENLFFFINDLLDFSRTNTLRRFSNSSSDIKFDSFDQIDNNVLYYKKFISQQGIKLFPDNDFGKTLKILYDEPCTPVFGSKSDKNCENKEKENYQNIRIRKDSSLTLSGEQEIDSLDKKLIAKNKRNSCTIANSNNVNEKKYENLLEMINTIYKKGIINSEEKIRLKQLVIAKSIKLENLYNNTFRRKLNEKNVLRTEITKLLAN